MILLKSETVDLVWNQAEAKARFEEYKAFWSRSREFGITGRADAGTGQPNSPNVFTTILRHGDGKYNRKQRSKSAIDVDEEYGVFNGAGTVLEALEDIINLKTLLPDEVEFLDYLLEVMETIESDESTGQNAKNPRNIPYHTIIGEDEDGYIRGIAYGHFLTPEYWQFRTDKAKKKKQEYAVDKPDKSWTNTQANKAKPPMWLAMFDPTNGLVKLIQDIKKIVEETMKPANQSHIVTFNQRKVGGAANLTGIRPLLEKVLNDPSIYAGNQKSPRKSRLREAIEAETLQVNEVDLKILSEVSEVIISDGEATQKVKLEDVPNFEEIKAVNIRFPPGNHRTLNQLIREVMGEEFMNTFRRPGLPEDVSDGLTLKAEVEMIEHATGLMKKILLLKDEKVKE